jgi:hypothetical protein
MSIIIIAIVFVDILIVTFLSSSLYVLLGHTTVCEFMLTGFVHNYQKQA